MANWFLTRCFFFKRSVGNSGSLARARSSARLRTAVIPWRRRRGGGGDDHDDLRRTQDEDDDDDENGEEEQEKEEDANTVSSPAATPPPLLWLRPLITPSSLP